MTEQAPKTTPKLRDVDVTRAARLLIHWIDGDQLGIQTVLAETSTDPSGVNGLLAAITHTAALLAVNAAPDGTTAADNLRQILLDDAAES